MDRNNKYYCLIEELVKNHKKFPGYEAILDEIIDDVYSHAEVIIKSVNNESVIHAYIEKTISTSLITVPKKMNFHKEIKHREIVTNTVPETVYVNDNVSDIKSEAKAPSELVDKMINSSFDEVVAKDSKPEEVQNVSEDILDELSVEDFQASDTEENIEAVPEITDEELQDEQEDDIVESDNYEPDEIEDPESIDSVVTCDDDAADVEQEVSDDILDENAFNEEDISEIVPEDDISEDDTTPVNNVMTDIEDDISDEIEEHVVDSIETLEIDDSEDDEEISIDIDADVNKLEYVEPDETDDFDSEISNDNVEELALSDNYQDSDEISEVTDLSAVEDVEVSEDLSYTSEIETNEILESPTDTSEGLLVDTDADVFEIQQAEPLADSLSENLVLDDTEQDLSFSIEETEVLTPIDECADNELNTELGDYADVLEETSTINDESTDDSRGIIFDYIPKSATDDVNVDVVVDDILKLNKENPKLKIIEVYELRYNNHYKIDRIAEELGIQKSDVILALNKLVELV